MKEFSIIIPVFNGESHIAETVESVVDHSKNHNCEILVINDGSTDSTLNILEKYKEQVIIYSQSNAGEANAVNKGLSLAQGNYGLVVSADDPLLSEELLSQAKKILDLDNTCVATYPDWQMINAVGDVISIKKCPEYSFEELLGDFHCIPGPGTVFRLESARGVGGRSSHYKFVSDYEFWLRLALKGKFVHIPQVLAQWRSHEGSTSVSQRGESMAQERITVIQDFLNNYPQRKSLRRQAMACSLYNAALLSFFNPEIPGRKWMLQALLIKRGWIRSTKIHIVFYLLFLPFTRHLYNVVVKFGLLGDRTHR